MSTAAVKKLCCVCGIDVSGQKRTKDARGRYYCQPCYSSASGAAAQTTPAEPSAEFACSNCHGLFASDQVYDCGGEFVCHGCYADRAATPPLVAPVALDASSEELMGCPECGGMFTIANMDPRGVCQQCAQARNPTSAVISRRAKASTKSRGLLIGGGVAAAAILGVLITAFVLAARPANRIRGTWRSTESEKRDWILKIDTDTLELSDGRTIHKVKYSVAGTSKTGRGTRVDLTLSGGISGTTVKESYVELPADSDELWTNIIWTEAGGWQKVDLVMAVSEWKRK